MMAIEGMTSILEAGAGAGAGSEKLKINDSAGKSGSFKNQTSTFNRF